MLTLNQNNGKTDVSFKMQEGSRPYIIRLFPKNGRRHPQVPTLPHFTVAVVDIRVRADIAVRVSSYNDIEP